MYQMFLNLLGTQLRIVLSASCLSYKATKLGGHPDHKNPGPVWKQVWHYKDPSLLKCHVHMFLPVHHCSTIPFIFVQMLKFNLLEHVIQMSEIYLLYSNKSCKKIVSLYENHWFRFFILCFRSLCRRNVWSHLLLLPHRLHTCKSN